MFAPEEPRLGLVRLSSWMGPSGPHRVSLALGLCTTNYVSPAFAGIRPAGKMFSVAGNERWEDCARPDLSVSGRDEPALFVG